MDVVTMKHFLITVLVVMNICSCGIFTPRDDLELPASATEEDPFSFSSLLDETGEEFSKLDLSELLHPDIEYTNVRLGDIPYYQDDLISHLRWRINNFSDLKVTWTDRDGFVEEGDTLIMINEISYQIVKGEISEDVLFSGTCQFIIKRGLDDIWRIFEWIDEPTTSESFFSPAE
jgi:hypothetical protein